MDDFDKPHDKGRRIFIRGVGSIALGLVSATMFGGCETLIETIKNRPIRRRLRTGSPAVDADIAIYRDAVAQMKALPNSDPRSWFAQAAIHGTAGVSFNFCQHGTNLFFPWHRAYLLYFEQICRKLTGESKFGLPYWNWNQNPDVHAAFLDSSSSLYEGSRVNTSVTGVSNFTDITLNPIFEDTNFFTFSSQIEGTPHNRGHTHIGGILGGFGSASDPLFWMHHCMVDYCWAKWNIELDHDNTNDSNWLNTSWNHFYDGDGNPASSTAGLTILMPLLSYRYECSRVGRFGCPLNIGALSQVEFKRLQERVKKGARVSFDIKKRVPISKREALFLHQPKALQSRVSAEDFAALVNTDLSKDRIFLRVSYAHLPSENDFFVRVFINLPTANAATSIKDDHFAGSFSFFGTKPARMRPDQKHKLSFLVNVTGTLRKLKRQGKIRAADPIAIHLVAIPEGKKFIKSDMKLELESIELIISPVTIRSR